MSYKVGFGDVDCGVERAKVVFVDVDGVLNTIGDIFNGVEIDPVKVLRLKRVVEATGCVLVLSSSWRHSAYLVGFLNEVFGRFGLSIDSFTDSFGCRRTEIRRWIEDNMGGQECRACVLDDDSFAFLNSDVGEVKILGVLVDSSVGITDADADKMISFLGRR